MPISQGSVTLPATESQPVRVANAVACRSFALSAKSTNTQSVYLGGSHVSSSGGFELAAGESVTIDGGGIEDLYVAGLQSDVVTWLAAS